MFFALDQQEGIEMVARVREEDEVKTPTEVVRALPQCTETTLSNS
jgi:hypothetical protein